MIPEDVISAAIQQAELELAEANAAAAAAAAAAKQGPLITNTDEDSPQYQRLVRMAEVASKFASTLVLKPVATHVVSKNPTAAYYNNKTTPAPAWSDESNIWFSEEHIGDLSSPEVVVSTKGLTLHEVAHIMFTPRNGTKLVKEVRKNKAWDAFNALEDQRIENLMVNRFSNVSDWLIGTMAQHILNDPSTIPVALPLVHGRKYLPASIRSQVATLYENQKDVVEICKLIDEYIVMNLSDHKNYARALEIIIRFNTLVNGLQPENSGWTQRTPWQRVSSADPNKHNTREQGAWGGSSKLDKKEQQRIADKASKSAASNTGNPSGEQGLFGGSSPESGDSNDQTSDSPSGGKGSGGSALNTSLEDLVQSVLQRKAKEIVETIARYNGESSINGSVVPTPERHRYGVEHISTSSQAVMASTSFARELQLLKAEYDPAWNKYQENGRLNVQRYALGCDVEEAFDQWDMGREDAVDIECVIALDISGSMSGSLTAAYESMWAIKRALDKVNASTTVVTFGTDANLLYDSTERALPKMKVTPTGGGTDPLDAIKFSRYKLAQSNRAIKLFIAITDGYWSDAEQCDKIIRELRRGGVLTSLGFINSNWWGQQTSEAPKAIDSHGCQVAVHIQEMSDLFILAKRMVKVGISNNLAG